MENSKNRWSDNTIIIWSWLFPITYLIHIAEEYWGGEGYSAYLMRLRGVHLGQTRFLLIQSFGVFLMALGVILARRLGFLEMMLVILGATVLVNGLTHTVTSALNGGYGPGLFSSLLIWIPLGIATLFCFKGRVSERRYWLAVVIGLGINSVFTIVTLRGGRIV